MNNLATILVLSAMLQAAHSATLPMPPPPHKNQRSPVFTSAEPIFLLENERYHTLFTTSSAGRVSSVHASAIDLISDSAEDENPWFHITNFDDDSEGGGNSVRICSAADGEKCLGRKEDALVFVSRADSVAFLKRKLQSKTSSSKNGREIVWLGHGIDSGEDTKHMFDIVCLGFEFANDRGDRALVARFKSFTTGSRADEHRIPNECRFEIAAY